MTSSRRLRLAGRLAAAAACAALAPASTSLAASAPHELLVKRVGAHGGPSIVRLAAGTDARALAAVLRRRMAVAYAVPNYVAHASYVPNDPGAGVQPGAWQELQWNFAGPFGVDAPGAWDHLIAAGAPGGRGVTVAVLDTGIAYENHGAFRRSPDFTAASFVPGYDFVHGDRFADDANGHGTHVAGTIAEAADNGVGVTGLAYGVRLMPVQVLDANGAGTVANIARGVRFAAVHGAQVINLSLEFSTDPRSGVTRASQIPALVSAIRFAHRRGVVVVAAAGNEGGGRVAYPARARDIIGVGATTDDGCVADYSNQGEGLDVVAPGGGSDGAVAGDVDCHPGAHTGRDIVQETFAGTLQRFGLPVGYEGTSMAVPHVSAAAALVIASRAAGAHPSPDAVEARLKSTVRDLGPAGWDRWYGAGLVNAGAATAPVAGAAKRVR
jgi:serine protease